MTGAEKIVALMLNFVGGILSPNRMLRWA